MNMTTFWKKIARWPHEQRNAAVRLPYDFFQAARPLKEYLRRSYGHLTFVVRLSYGYFFLAFDVRKPYGHCDCHTENVRRPATSRLCLVCCDFVCDLSATRTKQFEQSCRRIFHTLFLQSFIHRLGGVMVSVSASSAGDRVKPKTLKLVFAASPPGTRH